MIRRRVPLKRARMTVKLRRRKGTEAKRTAKRRRALEAEKRKVYRLVDERDGYACRLTGRTSDLEHHHILPRSRGGKHETSNLVLIHRDVHRDVTEKRVEISGDADRWLRFRLRDGSDIEIWPPGRDMHELVAGDVA